jgi:chromosome segregation ATPase
MPDDVDCKELDKKNEEAKWAARAAGKEEFEAFDEVEAAAKEIRDAHDYFDEPNLTDPEIIEEQIDLIEQARQETADQIREERADWSDAHGAGAGDSERINELEQEMKDLDATEERLAETVDDWRDARDEHREKSDEADEALDNWDEHCGEKGDGGQPDGGEPDGGEEPGFEEEEDEPDGGRPRRPSPGDAGDDDVGFGGPDPDGN